MFPCVSNLWLFTFNVCLQKRYYIDLADRPTIGPSSSVLLVWVGSGSALFSALPWFVKGLNWNLLYVLWATETTWKRRPLIYSPTQSCCWLVHAGEVASFQGWPLIGPVPVPPPHVPLPWYALVCSPGSCLHWHRVDVGIGSSGIEQTSH